MEDLIILILNALYHNVFSRVNETLGYLIALHSASSHCVTG